MKFVVLLALIVTVKGQITNLEVQQYVDVINEFMNKTKDYEYPSDNKRLSSNDEDCQDAGTFDFIIVGAGTTGCLLANRLSQVHNWKILVVEAGGNDSIINSIPGMARATWSSDYTWGYKSVPQKKVSLMGFRNSQEYIPAGKVVGGTSSINGMVYARGNKKDYDDLAAKGNVGWSYDDLLPLFKRSESADFIFQNYKYHGHVGELKVTDATVTSPLTPAYIAANLELGMAGDDYNGPNQISFSMIQTMSVFGKRKSSADAFLKPVLSRKNLKLEINSLVTKILMNGTNAIGIQYVKDKKKFCAMVSKEVILSAGVFNSAQLLMLSGIGPKAHLEKNKIEVIKNLPVGENLWNHIAMFNTVITNLTLPEESLETQVAEYTMGLGDLTTVSGAQSLNFVSHSDSKDYPDIENLFLTTRVQNTTYNQYTKTINYNEHIYSKVVTPTIGKIIWTARPILLHPKSRGTVQLKSNSPYEFPLIDPRYFTDPEGEDLKVLMNATSFLMDAIKTKAMQAYDSKMLEIDNQGCKAYKSSPKKHLECLVRHLASGGHHWAGTCKMGPESDSTTVVNPNLEVHGVNNLRVADMSIIPDPISGHTAASAYVIGEKLSDLIKEKYYPEKIST